MRFFRKFGFPLFAFLALALASVVVFNSAALPIEFGSIFMHIVFAAALIVAFRFGRLNLFFAIALVWAIAFLLTSDYAAARLERYSTDLIWIAAWYMIPINFVVFAFLEERSPISIGSLIRLGAVLLQIFFLTIIATSAEAPDIATWLSSGFFAPPLILTGAPQVALFLAPIFLIALGVSISLAKQKTLPIASFFALVGSYLALLFYSAAEPNPISIAYFLASAAIVVVGFFHLAYKLAFYDELTGVLGRRALFEEMGKLDGAYTIAMTDIDFFKKFNDEHGHDTGDQALKMVATKLAQTRGGGVAYRYGGEEFAILFVGKNKHEAAPFLEETRAAIEAAPFVKRGGDRPQKKPKKVGAKLSRALKVTISVGAADSASGANPSEVMKKADESLYKAKETGRNRVVIEGK